MAQSLIVEDDVQMSLLATSGHAGLAARMLTERLGLSSQYAVSVLDQGYGLLSPRMSRSQAREVMPLLTSLGLRVALQPVEALPPDEFCDLSIRLSDSKHAPDLIARLESWMGLTCLEADSFNTACGLVLSDLPLPRAEAVCGAALLLPGVHAVMSEHRTARYDLFAQSPLSEQDEIEVKRHLRLLGAATGGFGDALGSGLERRLLERVMAKFANLDLVGVNQAFQRHELLIVGKGSLSLQEFADFLMTRPAAQWIPMRNLLDALPMRVEACLTRSAAKQFLADYTDIGIEAITRLVWAPNTATLKA
jgi:hypothetical protein